MFCCVNDLYLAKVLESSQQIAPAGSGVTRCDPLGHLRPTKSRPLKCLFLLLIGRGSFSKGSNEHKGNISDKERSKIINPLCGKGLERSRWKFSVEEFQQEPISKVM